MTDDMALEEIEARLDGLDTEKAQADHLNQRFAEARDALDVIRQHDLVDEETAAKVALVKTMLQYIRRFDTDYDRRIHYERRMFRERAWEKKSGTEGGES